MIAQSNEVSIFRLSILLSVIFMLKTLPTPADPINKTTPKMMSLRRSVLTTMAATERLLYVMASSLTQYVEQSVSLSLQMLVVLLM